MNGMVEPDIRNEHLKQNGIMSIQTKTGTQVSRREIIVKHAKTLFSKNTEFRNICRLCAVFERT
jgi:hypothetical protein